MLSICRRKLDGFVRIEKEFSQFFNKEMVSSILENKADIDMVEKLKFSKASNNDICQVKELIENLNDRVK